MRIKLTLVPCRCWLRSASPAAPARSQTRPIRLHGLPGPQGGQHARRQHPRRQQSGVRQREDQAGRQRGGGGGALGVNAYLWRGALDTLSFMPLASADPFGGVIITDWYTPPPSNGERFKATAYILGRELRSDGVRVAIFRQVLQNGQWVDRAGQPGHRGRDREQGAVPCPRTARAVAGQQLAVPDELPLVAASARPSFAGRPSSISAARSRLCAGGRVRRITGACLRLDESTPTAQITVHDR